MARKRYTTEEIIRKLREADVLIGQGQTVANVIRQLGGYKDGTYKKVNSGKEDNEMLHEVIAGITFEQATSEESHQEVWDKIMGGVYEAFQIPENLRKQTKDWIGA